MHLVISSYMYILIRVIAFNAKMGTSVYLLQALMHLR